MANPALPAAGTKVGTITKDGVDYQVVMQAFDDGASGFNLASAANPLPVASSGTANVSFDPSGFAVDAFGRLRVSNPTTLFDSQLQYDLQRVVWESNLGGSSTDTHLPNSSGTTLAVTAAVETAFRQTRRYHRYHPGKSQLVKVTGTFKAGVAGVTKRIGYFDAENGVFLEQIGTASFNVVLRSKVSGSVVETRVAQASWNKDVMDGSGVSGVDFLPSKSQLVVIDLAWLSVGRVRVGFETSEKVHYFHEFDNANTISGPYMTTANLPIRYEIDNTTGASAADMLCLCSTVISEGGAAHDLALEFGVDNGAGKSVGTTENNVITIRPKATFNSITNRGFILPTDVNLYSKDRAGWIRVYYGATLGGSPSYTSANADSIVEFDTAGTTVTGGILLHAEYTDKKGTFQLPSDVQNPMTLDASGGHPTTPFTDGITVTFEAESATSQCFAAFSWNEIR